MGSGATGVVYRAFRDGSDRPLALKVMRPEVSTGSTGQRAMHELDVLESLRLDCVPRLIDYAVHDARLCIASEFVDGLPLDQHAQPLDRRQRVELLAKVSDAVQTLHEHAIIHRDLKPRNIIITPRGEPMLVDFGLAIDAAAVAATLTTDGTPVGTPSFMSPEQARGERSRVSIRSDVYALGAIAYSLLIGQTPHDTSGGVADALRRVAADPPREPRSLDPTLPAPLAAVLHKCVSPDPTQRYPTAADFGADLRRWLKGEPVTAKPPTSWQKAARWVGKHPKITSLAASVVIAGVVVGTAFVGRGILRHRPSHFVSSVDGRSVSLVSMAGDEFKTWANLPGHMRITPFAHVVPRPAALGGGRLALVIAPQEQAVPSSDPDLQLEASDVNDLTKPLWRTSSERPEGFDELFASSAPQFRVRTAILADVFDDVPGLEIVTVHNQPQQPSMIRIYDLAGNVHFQALHDGSISDVVYLKGPRLLLMLACDNEYEYREVDNRKQYVLSLTAIKPTQGASVGGLNGRFQDPLAMPMIEWRHFLTRAGRWPELVAPGLPALVNATRADPDTHAELTLGPDRPDPNATFVLVIKPDGKIHNVAMSDGTRESLPDAEKIAEELEFTPAPPEGAKAREPFPSWNAKRR